MLYYRPYRVFFSLNGIYQTSQMFYELGEADGEKQHLRLTLLDHVDVTEEDQPRAVYANYVFRF